MKTKLFFLSILSLLLIVSCEQPKQQEVIQVTTCKTLKAKDQPIENRVSGTEFFFGSGSITKSQSVYYFYYTDGTSSEVDRTDYFKYDIGSDYCVTQVRYK